MHDFVARMNSLGYELVIWTAATQDYADWVIDQIDPDRLIHHRLYRQHALPWGPLFAKDLSRLGRDLDRTLIIDNVQENFMMQPNNGIFIATWYDDPQDTALFELIPLLEELVMTRARVPDLLSKYREQIPIWAGFGRWDDCGLEPQVMDTPPHQQQQQMREQLEQPPAQQAAPTPPQYAAQPAYQAQAAAPVGQQSAAMPQQGAPAETPARVLQQGTQQPSPPYTQQQLQGMHQQQSSMTSPGGQAVMANAGYPQDAQQAWAQQTQQPQLPQPAQQPQMQKRPVAAFSGVAGPYQATQSVPQQQARPAFSGIGGPYQASQSMGRR